MNLSQRDIVASLPEDADKAFMVGRVWIPGENGGPVPCLIKHGEVYELSTIAPVMSWLLELEDLIDKLLHVHEFRHIGKFNDILNNSHYSTAASNNIHFLAPCDLQPIKASGVTFVTSLLERVIEELARGDKIRAVELRRDFSYIAGDDLAKIRPGSLEAQNLKQALIDKGAWSQYLEVGIGPDAEIFTKCPAMASVGTGAEIGVRPSSSWNNPEPEIVLAVNSKCETVGATLGNDVNLRDFEGRSALLLGEAKDNNASSAIGPFIRLFDENFTMDDIRQAEISLRVSGADGYELKGRSSMSQISRDPHDLVAQACSPHHQYPDGFMLYLGTMFAPIEDRDEPGQGFTHKTGDKVEIASPCLGQLVNWVNYTDKITPWTFGTGSLMRNLHNRGLLG
ncbi:MAG: fumarylacetoacetate hydrolase family protein [Rhizobiaceae bacterium]